MLLAAVCFSAFAWPQLAAVAIKWPLQLALVLLSTSVFVTLVRYRVQKESFFFSLLPYMHFFPRILFLFSIWCISLTSFNFLLTRARSHLSNNNNKIF